MDHKNRKKRNLFFINHKPFNLTAKKKRNQVRKKSINAIISHPSYVPMLNPGNKLAQNNASMSSRIKIPKTINKNVNTTINLLGGVHPIYITPFFFIIRFVC